MSSFQCWLFGMLWLLLAVSISLYIGGVIFKGKSFLKVGLAMILVGYVFGLFILGIAIYYS